MNRSALQACVAVLVAVAVNSAVFAAAVFSEARHNFGTVRAGTVVEHDFVLKNQGQSPVRIQRVLLTSPMVVTQMQALTRPGGENRIRVRLNTTGLKGHFEGEVRVLFNDVAA